MIFDIHLVSGEHVETLVNIVERDAGRQKPGNAGAVVRLFHYGPPIVLSSDLHHVLDLLLCPVHAGILHRQSRSLGRCGSVVPVRQGFHLPMAMLSSAS